MGNALENSAESSISGNRTLTERIAMYIPFYRGYKQKNLRRDEDRAVRDVVAGVLEACKKDLANAARATVGDLDAMRDMERVRAKVDRYTTDVKKSAAGYSAFHDSVKIKESELDAVITWDANLITDVETLKEQTEHMLQDMDAGAGIRTDLRQIESAIDQMINDYRQRDNVMRNLVESA